MTPKSLVVIGLTICWYAAPGLAWSSFMGPAVSRPKRAVSSQQQQHVRPLSLVMKAEDGGKNDDDSSSSGPSFSLANLFNGGKGGDSSAATATVPSLRGRSKLEPHPSVRPHISPLNRLGPDFDKLHLAAAENPLPMHPDVKSGALPNGFSYVILPNKSPPGRFEAHLQVFSGSGKRGDEEPISFRPPTTSESEYSLTRFFFYYL
jgi:hypothetical protein